MAIKFQYNKTSLTELNKQLKVRTRALPTLKSKESALRMEVKRAKQPSCMYAFSWKLRGMSEASYRKFNHFYRLPPFFRAKRLST